MSKRRASGEGMIRKKPNGDWEGRIVVGHKQNGNPIFRYVYGKTQKEMMQKLKVIKQQYQDADLTEDSNMIVSEWLDKWLTEYLPGTVRPQTLERYQRIVNTYIRPHIGKKKLAFLSTNEVQRMYVKLKKTGRIKEHPVYGHELADNTIIDIHATLHRAMEIAVNNHLVPKNPTKQTKRPKKKKKDLEVLNNAELDILMQAIDADEGWGDFFYLELTTGLRRGEICGLRWTDFDEKEGIIRIKTSISLLKGGEIYEGEPKTDESKRKILLPKITADRLRKRKRISEWIFPNLLNPSLPIAPPVAYRKAKSFLNKLNLPDISFHDLRHTFATHALATGVDAITLSTILGHTNPSFTVDRYTHVTGDMQKRASEIVGNFMDDIL
ncbi:MAG: site-specific integrase [Clostridia bacterium]|nr:site-specific integrase [Clostridia bacterium]